MSKTAEKVNTCKKCSNPYTILIPMTMQKNHHQMEIQKDPLRNVYVKKHIHDTTSKLIIGISSLSFLGPLECLFSRGRLGPFCFQGVGAVAVSRAMGLNLWDVPKPENATGYTDNPNKERICKEIQFVYTNTHISYILCINQ